MLLSTCVCACVTRVLIDGNSIGPRINEATVKVTLKLPRASDILRVLIVSSTIHLMSLNEIIRVDG